MSDADSQIQRDERFPDDEEFYRYISLRTYDPNTEKLMSHAFTDRRDSPGRCSVNLARMSSPAKTIESLPGYGVAVIMARPIYEESFTIEHTPVADNQAHCDIVGQFKSRGPRRKLALAAIVLIPPTT